MDHPTIPRNVAVPCNRPPAVRTLAARSEPTIPGIAQGSGA